MALDFETNLQLAAANVFSGMVSHYETAASTTLDPADPRRMIFAAVAYVMGIMYANLIYTGKQNLVEYGDGTNLEGLGKLLDEEKSVSQAASCTQRFSASAPVAVLTPVVAGKRVGVGTLAFAVTETVSIAIGDTYVDVLVECTTSGLVGNEYSIGQITDIVDVIPGVSSTENLTETAGGAGPQSDDSFRAQVILAPAKISTAGPEDAYRYHALAANSKILDAKVVQPTAGTINIYIVCVPGTSVTDKTDAVDDVDRAFNSDTDKRPLGDTVNVSYADSETYGILVTYYISEADDGRQTEIQEAIEAAVDEYILWQEGAIGRDIVLDQLRSRCIAAGAYKFGTSFAPASRDVDSDSVALFDATIHGGAGATEPIITYLGTAT